MSAIDSRRMLNQARPWILSKYKREMVVHGYCKSFHMVILMLLKIIAEFINEILVEGLQTKNPYFYEYNYIPVLQSAADVNDNTMYKGGYYRKWGTVLIDTGKPCGDKDMIDRFMTWNCGKCQGKCYCEHPDICYPIYTWEFKISNPITSGIKIMAQCIGRTILDNNYNKKVDPYNSYPYMAGGLVMYKLYSLHAVGICIHPNSIHKLNEIYSNPKQFDYDPIINGSSICEMIENKVCVTNECIVKMEIMHKQCKVKVLNQNRDVLIELQWIIPNADYKVTVDIPHDNNVELSHFSQCDQIKMATLLKDMERVNPLDVWRDNNN